MILWFSRKISIEAMRFIVAWKTLSYKDRKKKIVLALLRIPFGIPGQAGPERSESHDHRE